MELDNRRSEKKIAREIYSTILHFRVFVKRTYSVLLLSSFSSWMNEGSS